MWVSNARIAASSSAGCLPDGWKRTSTFHPRYGTVLSCSPSGVELMPLPFRKSRTPLHLAHRGVPMPLARQHTKHYPKLNDHAVALVTPSPPPAARTGHGRSEVRMRVGAHAQGAGVGLPLGQ